MEYVLVVQVHGNHSPYTDGSGFYLYTAAETTQVTALSPKFIWVKPSGEVKVPESGIALATGWRRSTTEDKGKIFELTAQKVTYFPPKPR